MVVSAQDANRNGGNRGGNGGGRGGRGGAASSAAPAATSAAAGTAVEAVSSAAASTDAAEATSAAPATSTAATGATGGAQNNGDPQKSLTLLDSVIAKGFASNGQEEPTAGQVASLTSTNNFINFCATLPNLPITNGQQIKTGSCNPAPIGAIPSTAQMPSSKFTNPKNGDNIAADTAFTISMQVKNLVTGNFVNAQKNYFAAPQQLDGGGTIIGHTHVVAELLTSTSQTTATDPNVFAFFKGVNGAAVNGVVTADVTGGLPAGAYRLCSINSSANHQPVIVPIAQHGALDDCVYFNVGGAGAAAGGAATGAAATTAATTAAAANAAAATAAAAAATANNGANRGGRNRNRRLLNRMSF